jgi:hypothetical protein
MQALRPIYHEPAEVRDQLLALFGVTDEPFVRATGKAWLEWATRTEFDAPSFPGTLLWGHTVRHERRDFVEHGWTKDDTSNFSSVISPDGKYAIAVETGDRFTGFVFPGKKPRTNSRKGVRMMQMLSDNRHLLQGDIFAGFLQTKSAKNDGAPLLWIHLIHQSRGDVYGEVSLPVVANDRNRIVGWECRIILPKWRGGDGVSPLRQNPLQPTPDAEVRVVRRTG